MGTKGIIEAFDSLNEEREQFTKDVDEFIGKVDKRIDEVKDDDTEDLDVTSYRLGLYFLKLRARGLRANAPDVLDFTELKKSLSELIQDFEEIGKQRKAILEKKRAESKRKAEEERRKVAEKIRKEKIEEGKKRQKQLEPLIKKYEGLKSALPLPEAHESSSIDEYFKKVELDLEGLQELSDGLTNPDRPFPEKAIKIYTENFDKLVAWREGLVDQCHKIEKKKDELSSRLKKDFETLDGKKSDNGYQFFYTRLTDAQGYLDEVVGNGQSFGEKIRGLKVVEGNLKVFEDYVK